MRCPVHQLLCKIGVSLHPSCLVDFLRFAWKHTSNMAMLLFFLHINFKDFCYLLFLGIQSLSVFISNCGIVCSLSVLSDYCFIPRSFSAHCCPSVPLSLVPMWTTAKSSHFLWGRPHIVRGENQHATPTYFVSDSKIFHILSLLIG